MKSEPAWIQVTESDLEWAGRREFSEVRPISLAIGVFDGVHRGHQAVLDSARRIASERKGLTMVLTFDPHPSRILRPEQVTRLLFSRTIKRDLLFDYGIDGIIWKHFTEHFAELTAEEFVEKLREGLPSLASVHVGANFRFGKKRLGDPETIRRILKPEAIEVIAVPRITWDGEQVSSTRLRHCLASGRLAEVNVMLGKPYRSRGVVVEGARLGRKMGFPTLNLPHSPESVPTYGVYVVSVSGPGAEGVPAVANYGIRPTVEAEVIEPRLEVHLLEPQATWDAGAELNVEWHEFLRPEQRFARLDELKEQIARDVEAAGEWFRSHRGSTLS